MSKPPEKRANVFSLLVSDPWRKLAAFLLAVLMWHYLDDQITDTIAFDLALVTTSQTDHPGSNDSLLVFVDRSRYFENGYFDRVSGERIQEVRLTLHGNRALVETIDENLGFKFTPPFDALAGKRSVEFTVADIRAMNPLFQSLVDGATMSPASVRLDLVENEKYALALTAQMVSFEGPPELRSRLITDRASFEPATSVLIVGPADKIQRLSGPGRGRVFAAALRENEDGTEASGTLRIAEDDTTRGLKFGNDERITVRVPMAIPFQRFTLRVPYNLDQEALDPADRRFIRKDEFADIGVEASGDFRNLLEQMPESDRLEWARKYCRLWVRLDSNDEPGIHEPEFVIFDPFNYIKGRDYKVNDLKPLAVERAPE